MIEGPNAYTAKVSQTRAIELTEMETAVGGIHEADCGQLAVSPKGVVRCLRPVRGNPSRPRSIEGPDGGDHRDELTHDGHRHMFPRRLSSSRSLKEREIESIL
jgi:hypothetical protein